VSTLIWNIGYVVACTFLFFMFKIVFVDSLERFRDAHTIKDDFERSKTYQDRRILSVLLLLVIFTGGFFFKEYLKTSYEKDSARYEEIQQQVAATGLDVNYVGADGYGHDEVKLTLGTCHPTFEVHRNDQGVWQLAEPVMVSYKGTVYNQVTDYYDPATLQKRVGFGFVTPDQIKDKYKACLAQSS
jgi:hypothetical protein